jgi:hypothetical protein
MHQNTIGIKIGLILIASPAITLMIPAVAQAEAYPQYVEIVKSKQSLLCQCVNDPTQLSNSQQIGVNDTFILNDDKIGDKAIARFGCDCAAHRRTIATEMAASAQMLIKQIN